MVEPRTGAPLPRAINVLLAVVIGAALVGFVVGTRAMPEPRIIVRDTTPVEVGESVLPGQTYRELRQRRYGPSSEVTSDLDRLRDFPALTDVVERSPALKAAAVAARAERRAFDGAPPAVPHVIEEQSATACLACHARGIRVAGRTASVMSHQRYTNCIQCHVPAAPWTGETVPSPTSSFVGAPSPGSGARAWAGAPPSIPHAVQMREDCHACHGVTGLDGLRTTHPERANCVQCHAEGQVRIDFAEGLLIDRESQHGQLPGLGL